jgi:hypothetical protein
MATAAKFVQPIPIFVGLSRSTRCGCCSYQVSSISVRRVTCYGRLGTSVFASKHNQTSFIFMFAKKVAHKFE